MSGSKTIFCGACVMIGKEGKERKTVTLEEIQQVTFTNCICMNQQCLQWHSKQILKLRSDRVENWYRGISLL